MKRTIILVGFGQMGKAVLPLLHTSHWDILGFADNDPGKWTKDLPDGTHRIISVEKAVACRSDVMLLCPISRARAADLKQQLLDLGYDGRICLLTDFYEAIDIRGASIQKMAERIQHHCIPGAIAELGVYQGEFSVLLSLLFPERTLYLFDTFSGFDSRDTALEQSQNLSCAKEGDFSDTSAETVLARIPYPENTVIKKGFFPDTAEDLRRERFALVSLDADLYAPTRAGLDYFYPRLNPGGVIILHDYNNQRFQGVYRAVEEYEVLHGPLCLIPLADLHGSCMILKPFPHQKSQLPRPEKSVSAYDDGKLCL
ncbi:MAG: TylF/MycF/NovP-related O-methyltransferase [Eubacteriales bacterium]|nr:TylF/MycF/NovP-related O-methyltransferase [Eubacteriales bacterium]